MHLETGGQVDYAHLGQLLGRAVNPGGGHEEAGDLEVGEVLGLTLHKHGENGVFFKWVENLDLFVPQLVQWDI